MVPTTVGTGSEVTLWSVITDPARHIKYNVGGTGLIAPYVALIDPLLMLDMPSHITGRGSRPRCVDACHRVLHLRLRPAVARCRGAVGDGDAGQRLPIAFAQGHNQEAGCHKAAMAAMLAGMSYGTESAGEVHAMSQIRRRLLRSAARRAHRGDVAARDGVQLPGRAGEVCGSRRRWGSTPGA